MLLSSNVAYLWRISVCIVRLRLRPIALILYFSIFLLSILCISALKICFTVFSGTSKAMVLKLGVLKDNE